MNTPTFSVWRNKPAINTRLTILAISLACAVSALPLDARAQAQATSINLPVQPLSKSLLQLGQQASVQIFFSQELVDGHQAPALSGSYSPEQALQQLLAGTGITYKRKGNTISLTPDPASSVAELSTITVKGGILGDLSPAYAGGQVATGGSLGLLGSVDVMDNPFSTTNYTSELLYDQGLLALPGAEADKRLPEPAVQQLTQLRSEQDRLKKEFEAVQVAMAHSLMINHHGVSGLLLRLRLKGLILVLLVQWARFLFPDYVCMHGVYCN